MLVVKTPSVPFVQQVMSQVVVVTSKRKLRSNSLPFMFIPAGASNQLSKDLPSGSSTLENNTTPSLPKTLISNSPRSTRSSSSSDTSSPTSSTDDLDLLLDICVQSLDTSTEENILSLAALPIDSLPVQGAHQLLDLNHDCYTSYIEYSDKDYI